ncbi:hypothetical protein ALC53_05223 [Atta colombica]|uniref:Uncharacterized protein n=1 Tax=Atta colombica TaxID=520822 RepID=A0A195BJ67_9HYME|nr:hypothetical protein ALC53_05223 [Atta colombica]
MGLVSRAKEDDPAGCEDLPQRLKSESNVVFTSREKLSGFLLGYVFHKSCLISNRTISADDSTAGAHLFDGKAGLIRANNSDGWDLRKGPSDRENQDIQYRQYRVHHSPRKSGAEILRYGVSTSRGKLFRSRTDSPNNFLIRYQLHARSFEIERWSADCQIVMDHVCRGSKCVCQVKQFH